MVRAGRKSYKCCFCSLSSPSMQPITTFGEDGAEGTYVNLLIPYVIENAPQTWISAQLHVPRLSVIKFLK
ncbi:hypothetical protein CAEBREN_16875 [Caenorhabditis brenneri]|uniref:Uncharacterized protein n=1 Tax=Caenorhabditis brenneri TaxID=135651 RepID=G0P149_CAEBE|nr:hypothetical protein CAEBREN_16875 [Caenorhabditis brenneri]